MVIDKYQAVLDGLRLLEIGDTHSTYRPEEVISYLLYPIEHTKLRLFYQGGKPIGLATWCWLSPTKANLFLNDEYRLQEEDYLLDNPGGDSQLWVIEFIAPYGHTRKVYRDLRTLHKELYGTTATVHFRRFYDRHKLHRKTI